MNKFKLMYDSENSWHFYDNKEYEDIDEAVREFLSGWANGYPFMVIQVVDWQVVTKAEVKA